MTDTVKDPRIEAVAKLLFTSPIYQHNAGDWDTDRSDYYYDRRMSLMAAEDVLRGIDEAAGWEYGIAPVANVARYIPVDGPLGQALIRNYGIEPTVRRRAAGEWEPLP